MTLQQFGETVFMPSKAVTMSENARHCYQGTLNRDIYPVLGKKKLPSITPAQISALLLGIQTKGKAHGTVIKVYTILQGLFKLAYLNDEIKINPMGKVQRPKPRKDEIKSTGPSSLTVEEVQRVIKYMQTEPLKWRVMFLLLADTGIRRGECCALRWENIDFKTGAVTIAGNLCYTPEKGVYLDTPKNGKKRAVSEQALQALRRSEPVPAQAAPHVCLHCHHQRRGHRQRLGGAGSQRQGDHAADVHPRGSGEHQPRGPHRPRGGQKDESGLRKL